MQAIIKVSRFSAMAHLNGHTFTVKEILYNGTFSPIFAIDIDGTITDFTAKELLIVDVRSELLLCQSTLISKALKYYAKVNRISIY